VVEWAVGVVCFGVVATVWWSSVPVNFTMWVGIGCGCGCWYGVVVFGVDGACGMVVWGHGVGVVGGRGAGGGWVGVAVRWGGGGVVHMVVGIFVAGGLVRGAGWCGVVGGSSMFRECLLPSIFPNAAIQAICLAKVYFLRVVQSCSRSLQSSYLLCPQLAACSGLPTCILLACFYIP
jgi:hypothetical protein